MQTTGRRERVQQTCEQDMTPMIDVVFLLIIFFLCIDFRVLEAKLPAYLPKNAGVGAMVEPEPRLHVAIVCSARGIEVPRDPGGQSFRLEGHRIHWRVDARTIPDADALRAELDSIYARRSTWIERDGLLEPLPVVCEPGADTTYGDVARTLDAISAAGFREISFGGGPRR